MKYITTITPTGSPVGSGRNYEIEIEEGGLVRVNGKEYQAPAAAESPPGR